MVLWISQTCTCNTLLQVCNTSSGVSCGTGLAHHSLLFSCWYIALLAHTIVLITATCVHDNIEMLVRYLPLEKIFSSINIFFCISKDTSVSQREKSRYYFYLFICWKIDRQCCFYYSSVLTIAFVLPDRQILKTDLTKPCIVTVKLVPINSRSLYLC